MKINPIICILASTVFFGEVTLVDTQVTSDEKRYENCLNVADHAPDRAINLALVWKNEGGGIPARHCEAVGLSRLGEHAEAAIRLEMIATDMRVGKDMPIQDGKRLVGTSPMLADMYSQAANAWLLATKVGRAEDAIQAGLSLTVKGGKQEWDLLLDRARIAAADRDYTAALTDLETIYQRDTRRTDILVLLASSARLTDQFQRAFEAITDYIAAHPDDPAGYLELGNLSDATGRIAEARRNWLKVVHLAPESKIAEDARSNIERSDVQTDVQADVK